MPQAIPLVIAGAGAYATSVAVSVGFSAFTAAVIGGVVSAGLSYATSSLMGGGGSPSIEDRARGLQDNISNPAEPIPVIYGTVRVGGIRVYADTSGTNNRYLHMVIVWGEGTIQSVGNVYLDDLISTDAKFSGLVDFGDGKAAHLGTDTQTADSVLDSRMTNWTTNHRLLGTAYTYIQLDFDAEAIPRVPIITADISGKRVYDVRDGVTKFSNNPALCIYDYMTNNRYGMSIPSGEIDTASFQSAANACDVTADGGARFTCDGVVDTSRPTIDNLKDLLTSCRGMVVYSGGKYKLIIDTSAATSYTFNEDNIVGQWAINFESKESRKNRVRAAFFNSARKYQPDFAIIDSDTYRTEDNGNVLERRIDLPFTTSATRAKRIAETELKQSRFSKSVEFTAFLDGLRAEVGDVVAITHSTPGWVNKQFRVMAIEYNSEHTVRIRAREYDASVYSAGSIPGSASPPSVNIPRPVDLLTLVPTPTIEQSTTWIETFENDVTGWVGSGATIAQDADAAVGLVSGLVTGTGSAAGNLVRIDLDNSFWYAATVPGRRVRVQFWYKQPSTNASTTARVSISNGTNTAFLDITPTASWQNAGFLFAPSVIGSYLRINVYPDRAGTNHALLIDNIVAFVVPDFIDAASIDDWIGTAAIGSAYIADAAITSAKIGSAAITNAKIGTAAVDTLQIAGNAVTVPNSATGSGSVAAATWTTIATVSWTSQGGPILAFGTASLSSTINGAANFRIRCVIDGNNGSVSQTTIDTVNGTEYGNITAGHKYTPASGSCTVNLQVYMSGAGSCSAAILWCVETMR